VKLDVRPARPGDAKLVAPLLCAEVLHAQRTARYYDVRDDFDWNQYTRARIDAPDRELLVARLGTDVVGILEVRVRRHAPRARRVGWLGRFRLNVPGSSIPLAPLDWGIIEACYVDERFRRRGVGRALVGAAMRWFEGARVQRVELGVLTAGEAVSFWEACGFRTFRLLMSTDLGPASRAEPGAP